MALNRKDPYFGYNFAVELDGITRMGFKGCTGLDSNTTSTKYREGTDTSLAQRELPSLLSHSAITLTRGITDDRALWDWRNDIAQGKGRATTSRSCCATTWAERRSLEPQERSPKWSGRLRCRRMRSRSRPRATHEGVDVQKW
jgi:phage tail-like protein